MSSLRVGGGASAGAWPPSAPARATRCCWSGAADQVGQGPGEAESGATRPPASWASNPGRAGRRARRRRPPRQVGALEHGPFTRERDLRVLDRRPFSASPRPPRRPRPRRWPWAPPGREQGVAPGLGRRALRRVFLTTVNSVPASRRRPAELGRLLHGQPAVIGREDRLALPGARSARRSPLPSRLVSRGSPPGSGPRGRAGAGAPEGPSASRRPLARVPRVVRVRGLRRSHGPPEVFGRVCGLPLGGSSRTSLAGVRVVSIGMLGPIVRAMVIDLR